VTDEVLFTGKWGVYCKVDVSQFLASSPIDLKKIEDELSSIGFTNLGDIFCSSFSGMFVRGYAQPHGVTYASLIMRLQGNYLALGSVDFYSVFASGASLTTSIVPELQDSAEKKIYRTSSASSALTDIHREHEERLGILTDAHGLPRVVEESLLALAMSIDEFLVREAKRL
jgi:hypothetical protein